MKYLSLLLLLTTVLDVAGANRTARPPQAAQTSGSAATAEVPSGQENARKARALLDQAIQALGGPMYLNIRNKEEEGRTYSFFHGRPTSNGVLFWRFVQYPDKERVEVTKERDVAQVYFGDKGWEITYKGAHPMDQKDVTDYLRRRR